MNFLKIQTIKEAGTEVFNSEKTEILNGSLLGSTCISPITSGLNH